MENAYPGKNLLVNCFQCLDSEYGTGWCRCCSEKTASRQRRTLLVCVCKFWWVCTHATEVSKHGKHLQHAMILPHIGLWHGDAQNSADTASIIKLQTQLSLREDGDSLNLSPNSLGRNGPEELHPSRNGDHNKSGRWPFPVGEQWLPTNKNFWSSLRE